MSRRFPPSAAEQQAASSEDPSRLRELAEHRSSFVRSAVARNQHTPVETLAMLAAGEDKYVRSAVARNWAPLPVDLLLSLVADPRSDEHTGQAVAKHPAATAEVLRACVSRWRGVTGVMENVSAHRACPSDVLAELSTVWQGWVKANVATHAHTDDATILAMLSTRQPMEVATALSRRGISFDQPRRTVRRRGRMGVETQFQVPIEVRPRFTIAQIEAMATSPNESLLKSAASQINAPFEVLVRLARHDDKWVRVRVAENPAAPIEALLEVVAQGGGEPLAAMAAREEALPVDVVAALAATNTPSAHARLRQSGRGKPLVGEPDPEVRRYAARVLAPGDAEEWRALLADADVRVRESAAEQCPVRLLEAEVGHGCAKVRTAVARRSLDEEVLATLGRDASAVVRRRVVDNRACPTDALALLAQDGDVRVQRKAAERMLAALGSILT